MFVCVKQVEESAFWKLSGQRDGEVGEGTTVANPREIVMLLKVKLVVKNLCDQEVRDSAVI